MRSMSRWMMALAFATALMSAVITTQSAQAGTFNALYSFCSQPDCTDGFAPAAAPLIQATDGNLYGTTYGGGALFGEEFCPEGCGTIFKITPSGTLSTIYSFC